MIEIVWPVAFGLLAIFILVMIVVIRQLYDRLGVTNEKLDVSNATNAKLQKSIDNLIDRREELFRCLCSAKSDEERLACIRRIISE